MIPLDIDHVHVTFNESAQTVLRLIAAVVLFSVALELKPSDLVRVVRRPLPVLLALVAQFLVLPLVTLATVMLFDVRGSIALGMLLVACCPPGKLSNLLTLRSGGDAALSVSMTLVSNLVSLMTLAVAFPFWVGFDNEADKLLNDIRVSSTSVLVEVGLVIALPLMLGLLCSQFLPHIASFLRPWLSWFGFGALLLLVVASLAANWSVVTSALSAVFLLVLVQDGVAFLLGYFIGRTGGLDERARRATTFEVGVRNAGIGLVLVFDFFGGLGGMAVVVAWWSVWDVLVGLGLAGWWSKAGRRRVRGASTH